MLKIALLHFCFEDYTIELANSLVKYVDLTLIHPEKVSAVCKDNLDPSIRTVSFPKPRIRDPRNLASMMAMMRIIKEVQPDVLHVQETNDPWYDLTLLLNQMPPLVTTIHDVFRHPGDRESVLASEYTKRLAFYRSQQLIVHTQSLKNALTKNFHVPQQRVNVIPHGELGSLYKRRTSETSLQREPYTLLFFGRIWPYKGLKYLLEAMPIVAAKIPEVKLIIAGRGENIEQYFPTGYDSNRIHLLNDFIPLAQVADLFQSSTVSVLPYIEASQSGVAALSYGMGIPVIASDIGGLSEIVRHQKDGFLVPPGDVPALADAIFTLLSDRNLQYQMQAAARERCQQDLNWSNIAEKTVETYHRAIKM
ncbi:MULTISPECIES: glycosyltransferase family 4 protein [Calothrix]|uniref:Glycosyltransferase family 4 protein n=2 Tax=Calothrix TaxID=1186 RepID=A0ABR8ABJ8_9CYAN|nr:MULTISPECIES: glycosyltransferase family 4 protein [Calothrix]MBD2197361.1 glycosyltransferase family 4 protein [Calothrix parietina FACHB-288]MBD2228181.1 glycosyltransferase family 4 protein [Calothrix anomala FACHB-343]